MTKNNVSRNGFLLLEKKGTIVFHNSLLPNIGPRSFRLIMGARKDLGSQNSARGSILVPNDQSLVATIIVYCQEQCGFVLEVSFASRQI